MKKILSIFLLVVILCGCANSKNHVDLAMSLRQDLLSAKGCTFDAAVTADYSDMLYSFTMKCAVDDLGNLTFSIMEPTSVAGISGVISCDGGALTFDDKIMAFDEMVEGQISPICAPWVFVNTLRGGYINACEKNDNGYRICIDDSYQEECLQLDVWTDMDLVPSAAEILWQGRRILTLEVSNFKTM